MTPKAAMESGGSVLISYQQASQVRQEAVSMHRGISIVKAGSHEL